MTKLILPVITLLSFLAATAVAQSPTASPSPTETSQAAPSPSPAETPKAAPTPQASETPARLHVEHAVATGNLIHKVNPDYPREARAKHIQGDVVLKMTINVKGDVENLMLVEGDPLLGQAAINAVKKWKYTPFLLNGKPVPINTVVKINFHL